MSPRAIGGGPMDGRGDDAIERIARLEEQLRAMRQEVERAAKQVEALREEQRGQIEMLRAEQREHADTIAKATGGLKVIFVLSAIGGLLTMLKGAAALLFNSPGH